MSRRIFRTRNRAIAALVRTSENIVTTNTIDSSGSVIDLVDSDYIQARVSSGTDSATVITLIEAANDSDRSAGASTRVFRMSSAGELNTLSQHNGLGTEIGTARVGDIAYIAGGASRGDVWALTNISGPQSGYTSTGFRVQTNNGTITRAFFDIVPSGQLPSQNFAVGMSVARGTGGQDARTITAVSDTGAMYNGAPNLGYIDFTPSMAGYAPPFDNKYMHTDPVPLTTWHKLTLDSAEVAQIAGGLSGLDSTAVVDLIDSSYINARVNIFDSATVTSLVDSAYIQLRDRFQEDSNFVTNIVDSAYIQARQSNSGGGGSGTVDSAQTISLINSVIDSSSRSFTYTYTATSNQTTFSGADDNGNTLAYSSGNIITFLNGILLVDSEDYVSTSGNSIVLNSAANLNDILNVIKFRASGSGGNLSHEQYKYTVSSPTTTFSGNDDKGNSLSYETGELQVYLNGILLIDSQDYTASNGTSVVLTAATDSNDVLAISKYIGGNSSITNVVVTRQDTYVYTTASPTTTISGTDDNNTLLGYIVGQIQVFQNGILLIDSADYTATGNGTIALNAATDSGDTIIIQSLRGSNTSLDSADVLAIAGGGGGGGTDSATVISLSGELKGGMFRINPQSLSINTTIDSNENAHVAGPISFDSGVVLTINGNLVIS
jgi:hypothetical protein